MKYLYPGIFFRKFWAILSTSNHIFGSIFAHRGCCFEPQHVFQMNPNVGELTTQSLWLQNKTTAKVSMCSLGGWRWNSLLISELKNFYTHSWKTLLIEAVSLNLTLTHLHFRIDLCISLSTLQSCLFKNKYKQKTTCKQHSGKYYFEN